jgi:hypothetical protein
MFMAVDSVWDLGHCTLLWLDPRWDSLICKLGCTKKKNNASCWMMRITQNVCALDNASSKPFEGRPPGKVIWIDVYTAKTQASLPNLLIPFCTQGTFQGEVWIKTKAKN